MQSTSQFYFPFQCKSTKNLDSDIIHKKSRPPKNYVVSEQDKITKLKYVLAQYDTQIKSLEMEDELMRDLLSLTERK